MLTFSISQSNMNPLSLTSLSPILHEASMPIKVQFSEAQYCITHINSARVEFCFKAEARCATPSSPILFHLRLQLSHHAWHHCVIVYGILICTAEFFTGRKFHPLQLLLIILHYRIFSGILIFTYAVKASCIIIDMYQTITLRDKKVKKFSRQNFLPLSTLLQ